MNRHEVRLACVLLLATISWGCDSRSPVEPPPESPAGSIHGTVLMGGSPLSGADVHLTGPGTSRAAVSDAEGGFSFSDLPPGVFTVGASHAGVHCASTTARMEAGETVTTSIACTSPAASQGATIGGLVAVEGAPLGGARVLLTGLPFTGAVAERSVVADASGRYTFAALTAGIYEVTAQLGGFACASTSLNVGTTNQVTVDIACLADATSTLPPPAADPTGRIAFERNGEIKILEIEGLFLSTLIDGQSPSWSADGRKLVFQRRRCLDHSLPPFTECDDIWSIHADGSGLSPITGYDWVHDEDPVWSPDGTRVAYARFVHGPDQSYLVVSDTDPPSPLWSEQVLSVWWPYDRPTWSPDGATIAFACAGPAPGWELDICVVAAAADRGGYSGNPHGGIHKITTGTWTDADPAWSPDGEWIAFTTDRPGGGGTRIAIVRPDGTGLRTLVPGRRPAWSPDGSRLAFVGPPEQPGLWRVNADGSGLARLTTDPADDAPSWGP